jgi:flagellar hook assembly protein FlgD
MPANMTDINTSIDALNRGRRVVEQERLRQGESPKLQTEAVPTSFQEQMERARLIVQRDYEKRGEQLKAPNLDRIQNHLIQEAANDMTQFGFEEWLQLTIAGFKNQDPMNPEDPGKMVTQFATMGMTVGFAKAREDMAKMMEKFDMGFSMRAASMIGQKVEAQSTQFRFAKGQDSEFGFFKPRSAEKISVEIFNERGQKVHEMMLDQGLVNGRNVVHWNGQLKNGTMAPDGIYTFAVQARDRKGDSIISYETGKPYDMKPFVKGIVEEFWMDQGTPRLKVDGAVLPFSAWRAAPYEAKADPQNRAVAPEQGAEPSLPEPPPEAPLPPLDQNNSSAVPFRESANAVRAAEAYRRLQQPPSF